MKAPLRLASVRSAPLRSASSRAILRDQVEYLRSELARREETHLEESRRKDSIIAALTQRIPEIEPPRETPSEARESPTADAGEPYRVQHLARAPWWRRMFGG
jgi:hypothetical protein